MNTFVFNLEETVTVMNDDKRSRLRKNMIKDSADKLAVLIFKSVIEEEKKGSNFAILRLCKCGMQRYLHERVSKNNFINRNIRISNNLLTKRDNDVNVHAKNTKGCW